MREETKHLCKGSSCPSLASDKIRIYGMRFCPFTQRVVLTCEAKKIPYDLVLVDLMNKPEWLFEKSPGGKVPSVELSSGDVLYDSGVLTDFLDESYGCEKLGSKDPVRKAKDKLIVEEFGKVCQTFYRLMYAGIDEKEIPAAIQEYENQIGDKIGKALIKRGTEYLGGDKPGLVDYMVWPWLERRPIVKLFYPDKFDYEGNSKIPEIKAVEDWCSRMLQDEAVKAYCVSPQKHYDHSYSVVQKEPKYDLLVAN